LIIVAGNTTSDDYGPAPSDHAFAYAIDMDGNWKWGKFFYNVSFAIQTISGCSMDAEGHGVFFGLGNNVPVVFTMTLYDGNVNNFLNLEKIIDDRNENDAAPFFPPVGSVFHDVKDSDDGKSYFYISFIMDDVMHIMKIDSKKYTIKYDYMFDY
jgi:hypothetical protein